MARKATKKDKEALNNVSVLTEKMTGFSTGYGLIDYISGVEGMLFPRATIVELYGLKSSSKTTLVLETIAFNQMINPDFKVLYADFEKMLRNEFSYLHGLGIDTSEDKFKVIEPTVMEEGCDYIIDAIKQNLYDMIIVDTIAAMRPSAEAENGFGKTKQIGIRAKLMSEFLRNIMADIPADGPAVIFINQMYKDLSTNTSSFVPMYKTPSSDTLAFYAGMRIEVRESTKLKRRRVNPYTLEEEELPFGSIINIKTTKNKVGMPFLSSKYVITYGEGIDIVPSVINAALVSGAIWTTSDSKLGSMKFVDHEGNEKGVRGMVKLIDYFHENVEDFVTVGSLVNELWAKDLSYVAERWERKVPSKGLDDPYENDPDLGTGLDLGGSLESSLSNEIPTSTPDAELALNTDNPDSMSVENLGDHSKPNTDSDGSDDLGLDL